MSATNKFIDAMLNPSIHKSHRHKSNDIIDGRVKKNSTRINKKNNNSSNSSNSSNSGSNSDITDDIKDKKHRRSSTRAINGKIKSKTAGNIDDHRAKTKPSTKKTSKDKKHHISDTLNDSTNKNTRRPKKNNISNDDEQSYQEAKKNDEYNIVMQYLGGEYANSSEQINYDDYFSPYNQHQRHQFDGFYNYLTHHSNDVHHNDELSDEFTDSLNISTNSISSDEPTDESDESDESSTTYPSLDSLVIKQSKKPETSPKIIHTSDNPNIIAPHGVNNTKGGWILRSHINKYGSGADQSEETESTDGEEFKLNEKPYGLQRYKLGHELGHGSFGVTYIADDIYMRQVVAVKVINIAKFTRRFNSNSIPSINDEIATLKMLTLGIEGDPHNKENTKYIVNYVDDFEDLHHGQPCIFIVSEYISGNDLFHILDHNQKNKMNIGYNNICGLFLQLILGLKYIHSMGLAHRDIKPENIMLTNDGNIKYIDFGLSCMKKCPTNAPCNNICEGKPGSLHYAPPEYATSSYTASLELSQAHDIWSLGILMYVLANGKFPYRNHWDFNNLFSYIRIAPEWGSSYQVDLADNRINNFINSILINNYKNRPSITMVYHNFINNVLCTYNTLVVPPVPKITSNIESNVKKIRITARSR